RRRGIGSRALCTRRGCHCACIGPHVRSPFGDCVIITASLFRGMIRDMTAQANGGTYSDPFIRPLRTSALDAAHHTIHPAPGSRLKKAAIPPVQVGGPQSQRLSIEAGHHTLMEQLQKILAEVDQGSPVEALG